MPAADVAEARDALRRAGERALRVVARAGEELLVYVPLARLAQRLEGGRVAAALGEAVAAVAERVRARPEAAVGERRVAGERERFAHVGADVLAHGQRVELVLGDTVRHAAGLLGALGGVLGEVA